MQLLKQYANVELNMNAIEKIIEYFKITTKNQIKDLTLVVWPTDDRLNVKNLIVDHVSDQPPVFKKLTFSIQQNQRVDVVNRTDAEKLSLTFALFRFLKTRKGKMLIDEIDISKIRLQDLRSRLIIIFQNFVFFSRIIRSNFDDFDEHNNDELRNVFRRVHLIPTTDELSFSSIISINSNLFITTFRSIELQLNIFNNKIFQNLDFKITEVSLNLFQDQRQLLRFVRVIIFRSKIMIFDEITSAVDMQTNQKI